MAQKNRLNLHKIVSIALCLALLLAVFPPSPAAAQSVAELERELAALKKEQQEIKKRQSQNEKKIKDETKQKQGYEQEITVVEKQLTTYNKKIKEITSQIDEKNTEIKTTQEKISAQNKKIEKKILEIEENNERFKQRLDAMYVAQSSNSYLSLLLGASSFSEFLSASETIKNISKYDQELLAELGRQQQQLEDLKAELEAQKTALEDAKKNLQEKKTDLDTTKKGFEDKAYELQELVSAREDVIIHLEEVSGELKLSYEENLAEIEETQEEKKRQQDLADKARREYENRNSGSDSSGSDGSASARGYLWPVPKSETRISSGYGWRWGRLHAGLDFAGPSGTSIYATKSGVVVDVQHFNGSTTSSGMSSYGNMVRLYHPETDTYSRYAHCSAILVSVGDSVSQGQTIARIGTTGRSTGNHLHFEISTNVSNSSRVNPLPYIS